MTKPAQFLDFFKAGYVLVQFDSTCQAVKVPPSLAGNLSLVLRYDSKGCKDVHVDKVGVGALMAFGGTEYETYVPWYAVYLMSCGDGRGVGYPMDAPKDQEDVKPTVREVSDEDLPPAGEPPARCEWVPRLIQGGNTPKAPTGTKAA